MSGDGVVDGLKLTIPGDELRRLLDERIAQHERSAAHWKRELIRSADEQTDDEAQQPDEMCANEAIRHEWRVDVLAFIREHVEPHNTYRIGERDLIFAELLPAKPWFVEQEEYEERTGVGFSLERLTKQVGMVRSNGCAIASVRAALAMLLI